MHCELSFKSFWNQFKLNFFSVLWQTRIALHQSRGIKRPKKSEYHNNALRVRQKLPSQIRRDFQSMLENWKQLYRRSWSSVWLVSDKFCRRFVNRMAQNSDFLRRRFSFLIRSPDFIPLRDKICHLDHLYRTSCGSGWFISRHACFILLFCCFSWQANGRIRLWISHCFRCARAHRYCVRCNSVLLSPSHRNGCSDLQGSIKSIDRRSIGCSRATSNFHQHRLNMLRLSILFLDHRKFRRLESETLQ